MFDAAFVGHVKALLEIEGATCACLANMDASVDDDLRKSRFFIDRTTTPDSYQLLLRGTNPGVGWIYDIDRFGCSSEASEWCMYCERSSEIAIIAFRCDVSLERYVPVIKSFKAVHIAEALKQQLAYGFSSQALAAAWRSELLAEYASRSQSLSGA
ncbi:MAG TPA: hypothetical protein PKK10_03470 [Woeseiaceae bacterium]|nr:hypothetical protein [Woeseiaceae bacterium]